MWDAFDPAREGAFSYAVGENVFVSRPLSKDEWRAMQWEVGIVDDVLLREFFGLSRKWPPIERMVAILYAFGWPFDALLDAFGLDATDLKRMVWPARELAVKFLYSNGMRTRDIADRLDIGLSLISRFTKDFPRHPRGSYPRWKPEKQIMNTETPTPKKRDDNRKRPPSDAQVAAIREQFTAGVPIKKIARDLHVGPLRIRDVTSDLPRQKQRRTGALAPEKIAKIRELYATTPMLVREIAKAVGSSSGTVMRYVKDLPPRGTRKGVPLGPRTPRATAPAPEAPPLEVAS